jgi:hypothetical protein
MAGKPKPGFYVVLGIVVLGLVGFALWRMDILAPKGKSDASDQKISKEELARIKGGGKAAKGQVEAPDDRAPTTKTEYSFVPEAKLPPVKGVSSYQPLADNTVSTSGPGGRRSSSRTAGSRPTASGPPPPARSSRSSSSSWTTRS